jgi:hypothetical protein
VICSIAVLPKKWRLACALYFEAAFPGRFFLPFRSYLLNNPLQYSDSSGFAPEYILGEIGNYNSPCETSNIDPNAGFALEPDSTGSVNALVINVRFDFIALRPNGVVSSTLGTEYGYPISELKGYITIRIQRTEVQLSMRGNIDEIRSPSID